MLLRCFRGRALAASLLLLAVSSIAHAQDDPRKLESKKYFDEGVALDASQRRSEALEKFKKAYAVYPSPNVLYNIAREEHLLGKLPDALRDYREAAKNPLLKTQNRDVSQTYIRELEQELGQVKLSGPEGTTFTLDGAAVTLTAEAVPATAGSHRVEATLKGRTEPRDVQFAKGQVTSAEFFAANATATEPPPLVPGGAMVVPPPEESGSRSLVLPLVLGGVAVAALATGIGFSIDSGSKSDEVDAAIAQSHCLAGATGNACLAAQDAIDAQQRSATIATIAYGASALAFVAAFVTWRVLPLHSASSRASAPAVVPVVAPQRAGLQFQLGF
jgi:hypothetical protein